MGETFAVATCHGTVLAADLATQQLGHVAPDRLAPQHRLILAHVAATAPDLAFLLCDNPARTRIAARSRQATGAVITLRINRQEDGTLAFHEAHTRQAMVAMPPDPGGWSSIDFHVAKIAGWEKFQLTKIVQTLPASVRRDITLIEQVVENLPHAPLSILRDATANDRALLADIVSGAITPMQAEQLAAELVADPSLRQEFAALLPEDPWARDGLTLLSEFVSRREWAFSEAGRQAQAASWLGGAARPAPSPSPAPRRGLLSWLPGRVAPGLPAPPAAAAPPAPSSRRSAPRSLDVLTRHGLFGEFASLGQQCLALARRRVTPQRDLCVLATARNEGLYLLDWIAYHRAIGVAHFFIYTNNNTDGSDRLLEILADRGVITLVENDTAPGNRAQSKVYGHAFAMLPELLDFRWCAVIDIDEWIAVDPRRFGSATQYLLWQELQRVDAIALNWRMMPSSGQLRWDDRPMPVRFDRRPTELNEHIKTILRPRMFHHATPHTPLADGAVSVIFRDAAGQEYPGQTHRADPPPDPPAWIAHYFFRSFEEYVWKFARGRGDEPLVVAPPPIAVPEYFMETFLAQFEAGATLPDETIKNYAARMSLELLRLRALPGVVEARAGILRYYQARSAQLTEQLRAHPPGTPVGERFYNLLLASQTA